MTGEVAQGEDLLRSGDLAGLRASLVDDVKRAPGDQGARMYLWQVMAVQGDWDKAVTQLRALAALSPEAQMLATVYNQAITAEKQRADAFAGRVPMPVLVASSPWIDQLAASVTALASGRTHEGGKLRDEAFDGAGDTPGELDGAKFAWISDLDPRLGPCFEAVVGGKWGLIPFEAVVRIKTQGPRDLRDVVWLPVELSLRSGQSAAALLPSRYPGSESGPPDIQLGRATDWNGDYPVGQRVWTRDDGEEIGVLDFRDMVMAA